jgi:glutamate racemase
MDSTKPIGIFDSGVGGLTVVREILKQLPNESIIYLGDTARVPYGIKSAETIKRFSIENTRFLSKFGVKLIVVACNTAAAIALDVLKKEVKIPVIGVIEAGVNAALGATKNGKIGIIGTEATIKSRSYERLIKKKSPLARSFSQSCSLLVPLVEEGWLSHKVTRIVIQEYLESLKQESVDTLILGCTHYPLLIPLFRSEMGKGVALIDSAKEVTCEIAAVLRGRKLMRKNRKAPYVKFYVSDAPERFAQIKKLFLSEDSYSVEQVRIEEAFGPQEMTS